MIKAIETRYKGYRFRSRLEARWAVFFDALGIKWEYEVEGYVLPSYEFSESAFIAQRGDMAQQTGLSKQLKQLAKKTKEIADKELYYLPDFWLPDMNAFAEVKPVNKPTELIDIDKAMRLVNQTGFPLLWCSEFSNGIKAMGPPLKKGNGMVVEFLTFWCEGDIESAITAARSARFEHGEKP